MCHIQVVLVFNAGDGRSMPFCRVGDAPTYYGPDRPDVSPEGRPPLQA
jgi:hypothetical protein